MKRNTGGVLRFLYPAVLFAAGVLAWFHFQMPEQDLYPLSVEFDNRLVEILNARGIDDSSIIVQTRQEHSGGKRSWIEYYREIAVPEKKDRDALADDVRLSAKQGGHSVIVNAAPETVDVSVKRNGALISRLILTAPRAEEIEKRPKAENAAKRIALVIDDIGGSKDLSSYLDLGIPVTFAVMPRERYSTDIAVMLNTRRIPFILHLPLEPVGYPSVNPGKAALLVSMTAEEMRAKFNNDLADVPGARGVSNHMGSRFTSDRKSMDTLLSMVKEKGLFFFDSYTSSSSVAGIAAVQLKVPHATNSFFLDVKDDPEFMRHQWKTAMRHARRYGTCIVIGHIQKKNMVPVLREILPDARKEGIEFVYLTEMVR